MVGTHKSGKKNRKHGRSKKKPSHKRYLVEKRWVKNKARKIRKYMKAHQNWKPYNLSEEVQRILNQ